jgi:NADPH-dependent 2,4-dienoyl-CoA reductase/sulfur reductase-like enzyme
VNAPTFDFDGRPIPFAEGASVGASLWAAGVREFRRTRGAGTPRALFCAIGTCFDCLVDVDVEDGANRDAGTRPVRSCRTTATAGVRVRSSGSVARPATATPALSEPTAELASRVRDVEVAVVGAGPAGLAAAAAAAGAGAEVLLLDAAAAVGGQIHRRSTLVSAVTGTERSGAPAVEHLARIRVVLIEGDQQSGFRLHLDRAGDLPAPPNGQAPPELVRARAVVLCSGATEVVAPFTGWTTPGVLTAGGMQALLKGDGVRAGGRVLVAGTGPLLLVVAAGLAAAGARVTLADESPAGVRELAGVGLASARHPATLVQAAGLAAGLARNRVQVLPGWRVSAVSRGADAADLHVRLHRRGTARELRVDAVGISHGLAPDVALAAQVGAELAPPDPGQWGRRVRVDLHAQTTVPGLFAAGELTGVAGAPAAHAEGVLAGLAAAASVSHASPAHALRHARRAVEYAEHGARMVSRLWPAPTAWWADLADAETLCRCEEVPAGSVRAAVAAGALAARAVKGRTRVGMGLCQGRVCGPLLGQVLQRQSLAGHGTAAAWLDSRPLAEPVDLARLASLG